MELDVVDLREPATPRLSSVIFARDEEAQGLVVGDDGLYFAFQRPHIVVGDKRAFVKHYYRRVDLSNPAHPVVGARVNVPGQLIAVAGERLLTRDLRWSGNVAENVVHTLQRRGDEVAVVASRAFEGRDVSAVRVDGGSRVLITHHE